MNVLVLGGTGYIGSAVTDALLAAGHAVTGAARSDTAAAALTARGAAPVRAGLADTAALGRAAREADAVVLAAVAVGTGGAPPDGALERAATTALVRDLRGSRKPVVLLSSTSVYGDTGPDPVDEHHPLDTPAFDRWRVEAERTVLDASAGVRGVVIRPPLVYGRGGNRFLRMLVDSAERTGEVRHVGRGDNTWSAVHVEDLADLLVRAVTDTSAGGVYNAAADAVTMRALAEAASRAGGAGGATSPWPLDQAAQVLGPFATSSPCTST